jgi:hypothetical protein
MRAGSGISGLESCGGYEIINQESTNSFVLFFFFNLRFIVVNIIIIEDLYYY